MGVSGEGGDLSGVVMGQESAGRRCGTGKCDGRECEWDFVFYCEGGGLQREREREREKQIDTQTDRQADSKQAY